MKMTIANARRVSVAVVLSFALILGFVQIAEAQAAKALLPLHLTVVNPADGSRSIPAEGGTIRVTVEYQGLTVGQGYQLDVAVMDLDTPGGAEATQSGAVVPVLPKNGVGSESVDIHIKEDDRVGHTLLVVAFLSDEERKPVAESLERGNSELHIQYGSSDIDMPQADGPDSAPGSSSGKAWAIAAGVVTAVVVGAVAIIAGVKRVIERVKNHR